jgi:hypothetical protein
MARRTGFDRLTIRLDEPPGPVVTALDPEAALVHGAVVKSAERHEIRELGLPSIGPVLDVVPVDIAGMGAAGENAALPARSGLDRLP